MVEDGILETIEDIREQAIEYAMEDMNSYPSWVTGESIRVVIK
jgi:hypothetical protein